MNREPAPPQTPRASVSDIASHLTEAITGGHLAVGAVLPTELELCAHYATSRHTIRAALSELQQRGLVSRRKNAGTRVMSSTPRTLFRTSLGSVEDLVNFGAQFSRSVQSFARVVMSDEGAAALNCSSGTTWLLVSSLRLSAQQGAAPIGWTDVYIDPRYADVPKLARRHPNALISSLIEVRYGRSAAAIDQEIRACAVDEAKMAEALEVAVGTPALRIVRRYLDAAGEVFEISASVHPADRYFVSMRLDEQSARPRS
jgi:DNA-binding GntR family transcriptional regulator